MADALRRWQEEATLAITELKEFKQIVPKMFPNKEHFQPLNMLQKTWRVRIIEFFGRDLYKLVHLSKLELLMDKANKLGIEVDNPSRVFLHSVIVAANEFRRQLQRRIQSSNLSYNEAKRVFSDMFTNGVYYPEANSIKDIIGVNSSLERRLCDTLDRDALIKIQRIITVEKMNVDHSLINSIAELIAEFERLVARVNSLIEKNHLDFKDLALLEEIDESIKNSNLVLPNHSQFKDIFSSYSWVIKTCLDYQVKATSIDHALMQLKNILEHKLNENYSEIIYLLNPISTIQFSLSPIREFMAFCKLLLWRAKVKSGFCDLEIDLNSIEELLATAPPNIEKYTDAYNEFKLINGVCEKAKDWRKKCQDYFAEIENLFELTSSSTLANKVKFLISNLKGLKAVYQKEDLRLIKNMNRLYEQLTNTETVLTACIQIARVIGGDKIDLEHFVAVSEVIESQMKEEWKYSMLMHQYMKIKKEFCPSLEQLEKVYKAVQEPASKDYKKWDFKVIMSKQKEKIKLFDIDFHLQKLNSRLNLGDFGDQVKLHLEEFYGWEKDAKTLMQDNPIQPLVGFATKEQVSLLLSKTNELKKNLIKSNLYSEVLEDLLNYYWCLQVIAVFFIRSEDLSEVKHLVKMELNHNATSAELLKMLKDQLKIATELLDLADLAKKDPPHSSDVRKAKTYMKALKIKLGARVDRLRKYIKQYIEVTRTLRHFFKKDKPTIEKYKEMIEILKNEDINYKREVKTLSGVLSECDILLRLAKKRNKPLDITKKYDALNIYCPELENIIKERPHDMGSEGEYEKILDGSPTYEELSKLEAEEKSLEDPAWGSMLKERIFIKKVAMIEDAIELKENLKITYTELKTLSREGTILGLNCESYHKKLRIVNELKRAVVKRLEGLRTKPREYLDKAKKMYFKCIDVSKEVDAIVNDIKNNRKFKTKSKSTGLKKRKPEVSKLDRALRGKEKPETEERRRRKERIVDVELDQKKKESLEQLKMTINMGIKQETTKPKSKDRAGAKEQSSMINYLLEFNSTEEKEKSKLLELSDKVPKPKNTSGIWGIFEGNCKNDLSSKTVDEVKLATFDSWQKIRGFSQLPLTLSFKEKISPAEFKKKIDASGLLKSEEKKVKILAGVVSCEGLSRINFKEVFDSEEYFYQVEYSRSTSLVLVPARAFNRAWLPLFEMSERVEMVDCDFYYFIFSEEQTPVIRINPFRVDRLYNKENSSFSMQVFKELEIDTWGEKNKTHISQRITTSMNEILGANGSVSTRADRGGMMESS